MTYTMRRTWSIDQRSPLLVRNEELCRQLILTGRAVAQHGCMGASNTWMW